MKKIDRRVILTCLIAFIAVAGVVSVGMEYRAGTGFHPFQNVRELQNKQVLFPDGDTAGGQSGSGSDSTDTDSFWKKDDAQGNDSDGGSGAGSGYLLDQGQDDVNGEAGGAVVKGGNGSTQGIGGIGDGNIYGIADGTGTGGTGLLLPGDMNIIGDIDLGDLDNIGGAGDNASHGNGGVTENTGNERPDTGNNGNTDSGNSDNNTGGGGSNSGGGSNGGGSQDTPEPVTPPADDEEKGPGSDLVQDPVPGNGSSSRDEVVDNNTPPPSIDEEKSSDFSNADPSILKKHNIDVIFRQPEGTNISDMEVLYKGQTDVSDITVFNSIEAYVWDKDDNRGYYWTADDLEKSESVGKNGPHRKYDAHAGNNKYVKITGVSFDGGNTIQKLPVARIPSDVSEMIIYISYRLDVNDAWTEYAVSGNAPGVVYSLKNSRILVLNKIIQTVGEVIKKENILNADSQYIDDSTFGSVLNLFKYQGDLLGADNTGRMKGLFPGWKEDGVLVPFLYSLDKVGRHVLEPSALISIDTSKYQINLRSHWMNKDNVIVESGGTSDTILVSLQALDDYVGSDKNKWSADDEEHEYDWLDTLDVPQYVQSVEFDYCSGFSVKYINIPDTVLYVNTNGIPTIYDSWFMYDRGIQVEEGYNVADGNPRYTAEDGLLYSKDKTEILGVPVKKTELTVGSDVTKVVLPYQTQLSVLDLRIDSVDDLPDINYERLNNKQAMIIVPDALLTDFINKQRSMLQRTGLYVGSDTVPDRIYSIKNGFMIDSDLKICDIVKDDPVWIELPEYAESVAAEAINKFSASDKPLSMIIMPESGQSVQFDAGSFDGYSSMMLVCYTEEQVNAAEALKEQYPSCSFDISLMKKDADGRMYLTNSDGSMSCMIPEDVYSIDEGSFKDTDSALVTIKLMGYFAPVLSGFEEGTPFSFGIDDSRIKLDLSMSSCSVQDVIDSWTVPMAGYYSSYSLKYAIQQELGDDASELDVYNELVKFMLAGENRVRALLGMEPASDVDDMMFETPQKPEIPDESDSQGKPALQEEPAVPKDETPADPEITEGAEKNTEEEEPEAEEELKEVEAEQYQETNKEASYDEAEVTA